MPNNLDVFWSILISRIQVYKTPVLLCAWGNSIWGKGRKEFILALSVAIFSCFRLYLVGPYPFSLGSLFTPVFVLILRPPVQSLFICISYTFLEKNRKSAGRRVRHHSKVLPSPSVIVASNRKEITRAHNSHILLQPILTFQLRHHSISLNRVWLHLASLCHIVSISFSHNFDLFNNPASSNVL